MKNFEKYKTADERAYAFMNFCNGNSPCGKCKLNNVAATRPGCAYVWLDLDAEEEKPMECPYCGSRMRGTGVTAKGIRLVCACGYSTGGYCTVDGAIASHNRICRAIKSAYKESALEEVKDGE